MFIREVLTPNRRKSHNCLIMYVQYRRKLRIGSVVGDSWDSYKPTPPGKLENELEESNLFRLRRRRPK